MNIDTNKTIIERFIDGHGEVKSGTLTTTERKAFHTRMTRMGISICKATLKEWEDPDTNFPCIVLMWVGDKVYCTSCSDSYIYGTKIDIHLILNALGRKITITGDYLKLKNKDKL